MSAAVDFRLELLPEPSAGRKAQRIGARSEKAVQDMLDACELLKLGRLRKRVVTLMIDRRGTRRPVGTSGCDWSGHLQGGRAVYLEAKHSNTSRLPFDCFSDKQIEELTRAHNDGAIAVVVVLLESPRPACFAVPWHVVAQAMSKRERESLSLEELKPWAVVNTPLLASKAFVHNG